MTSFGRAKKTFNSFEDAVKAAHTMNENPKTIWAQVAYKCNKCYKFHTGKNKHNILLNHKIEIYNDSKGIQ